MHDRVRVRLTPDFAGQPSSPEHEAGSALCAFSLSLHTHHDPRPHFRLPKNMYATMWIWPIQLVACFFFGKDSQIGPTGRICAKKNSWTQQSTIAAASDQTPLSRLLRRNENNNDMCTITPICAP
ncbi:unnamed protein product [Protopolystoma xenopodis]|uniref:Uncharacterized protein n=1 Tax=Protopolystoma xenopodis TaxID=117903 RepID=A0A3S5C2C6_9PLAT|nr:unnamed protein product [Protopolystoma xenopodis]